MALMEEKLPTENFLRIHKSYILPVNKIEAFTANTIEIHGKDLPIGRNFKNAVLNALNFTGPVAGV
jgi:DNA-binding LytR/AlgR family response regulator